MKDIFLQSTSKEQMISDLETLHPDFIYEEVKEDGTSVKNFRQAHVNFAIDYIGVLAKPGTGEWDSEGIMISPVEFYQGVHCNIRLYPKIENIFDGFTSSNTQLLNPETPCRVFA